MFLARNYTTRDKWKLFYPCTICQLSRNCITCVAQYINETNPEWCTEAEKYLKLTQMSKCSGRNVRSPVDSVVSPFRSMAATTEALALQHSVIGNRETKPVPLDVVAEVVARTQKKLLQQQAHNVESFQENTGINCSEEFLTQSYPLSQLSASITKDLQTEKPLYTSSKVPGLLSSTDYRTSSDRRSSISSISSKKGMRFLENDIPSVHASQKSTKSSKGSSISIHLNRSTSGAFSDQVGDSETESCFSEKIDLESVCSEAFETESNVSEVSGIGDEMFQVKKLLDDLANQNGTSLNKCNEPYEISDSGIVTPKAKSSPVHLESREQVSKCEQSTETDASELFEILRAKANLEGRLESISKKEIDRSKECSTLQSRVTTLQSQLSVMTKQCEQAISEKQSALKKLEFLDAQQEKWDNVIKEYQNMIETRNCEIKALKEDISEAEQANIQARINCEELKVDMESKGGAIIGLKKKIAELHVEMQVLLQGKVQLQNEIKSKKHDMEMLQKSKEWYQDQLHLAQESRDKLHKDLICLQSDHVNLNNSFEKSKTEINHLKQQLTEIQHRSVSEKEVLMKHLETIEADMLERESLFDEIQKDKGSVEDALLERAKRMEEERSKLTHLMFTMSDLEYKLSIVNSDITEKDKAIISLEKEKAELCKQVALLQKTASDKDFTVQQLMQNLKYANSKIAHHEMNQKSLEILVDKLKEEKNIADMALASANEEKCTINDSLKMLKENLHRVENNFKQMKSELVEKSSKVAQLLKEKAVLEDALKRSEENNLNQQKKFEQQIFVENQSSNVMVDDLKKQKHDIENVLGVYSKDLLSYQQKIQAMEQERKDLQNEVTKLQNTNSEIKDRLEVLNDENIKLHKKVLTISEPGVGLKHSKSEHMELNQAVVGITANSSEYFHKIEKDYKAKLKVYQSNIKFLTRKLKEKLKDCKSLNDEVELLKTKLNDSSVSHDESADIANELLAERRKVMQLEQELKATGALLKEERKHIEQNQKIIIDLEKEKGKMTAVIESNDCLKSRVSELEVALSEKDALMSHLSSQLKSMETELSDQHSLYESKLSSLEESVKVEKDLVKKLRQQVFQEKRANSHNQRQLATLKSGLEQANQIADARKAEIITLQSELDLKLKSELKHRGETEQLQTQILSYQSEVKQLKKELSEVSARDPALAQQIKSLSWHLKEKSNEISALKEKQKLLEERHGMEISALKKSFQNIQSELEQTKTELDVVRKQKFQYQSQLSALRKAVKSDLSILKAIESPSGMLELPETRDGRTTKAAM